LLNLYQVLSYFKLKPETVFLIVTKKNTQLIKA